MSRTAAAKKTVAFSFTFASISPFTQNTFLQTRTSSALRPFPSHRLSVLPEQKYACNRFAHSSRVIFASAVKIPCPSNLVGRVIGPKGATIKDIQTKSGAKVSVDKNTNDITIEGSDEAIKKAQQLVMAIVKPPSDTMTCGKEYLMDLIGKGGANLKKLKQDSGANINVNSDVDPIQITIDADSIEKVEKAKELINALVNPENVSRLQCPQKYASQIVGPGGETLNGLEAKYGVQIIMNMDADPVTIRVEGADNAKVQAAAKDIQIIIDEAIDPDYEGELGKKYRQEAEDCAKERSRCFDEASKIFDAEKAGQKVDKDKAYALLEQGKKAGAQMEEANKKAVIEIVKFNNEGKGDMYLDLHGLQVEEALGVLEKRLEQIKGKGDFELIPGAGNHSEAAALIKPKVEALLKQKGILYKEKNAGTFIAKV